MTQAVVQKNTPKIGEYVLTGKIGQGGIAEIFKARQESLGRDVAIKILFSHYCNDPEILRRFERESVVIAKLNHPNIIHVIDKGKTGSRYYFVMEYIDGTSLREVIDSPRISIKTKLEMLVQVCKALDYAHKNGVIHRDIKPANILVDRQGSPRVADFGIAQIVGTPETEATSSDMVMGTLAYMSPEQRESSTNVDQTTDLFAMGVIIYEILTGRKPVGRFKLPSKANSSIGEGFDGIVRKCLAQDRNERYQSADELKNAILNAIGGGTTETGTSDFSVGGVETFVGKCRYLDTIRENRYGSTILVENMVSKKLYVIKKHSKGETGRKEAKVLSSLKHEHILNVLGTGGDRRRSVIISDYAPGGSLADRMARRYDWPDAMKIILQITNALDFAHKNNIVHGNLRPTNVLFDANDNVKVTDFGLPPHYDEPKKRNWYSPPEHKVSRQGDGYAVGVILHQMITGRNPSYDSSGELRLDDIASIVPQEVRDILSRLLAIRVVRRYESLSEVQFDWDDFERRQSEKSNHRNIRTKAPVVEKKELPLWVFAAIGGGVVAVIALIFYLLRLYS